ncbi:phospholipase domain-containing protein [Nocardioides convexus]|uniref:phospholipase domain-containing protein n=1 Tax=Nocardioides convexus TaxID=2712224 RepID=UPI0024181AB7|nr:phospholipase domain-containing protein [Nocardioides convexus]
MPVQEPGTKPARPVPYQPSAFVSSWTVSGTTIKVNISMTNSGAPATRSAHYAAYANAFRGGGPWQYTVDPATTTTDFFNVGSGYGDGRYDLTVVGPNRFLRRFTGNAATAAGRAVEATTRIAAKTGSTTPALWFDLANSSGSSVTFTITSNHYRDDGPWTYTVPSGSTRSDYFDAVTNQDGWYDFTVTVSSDATWSRRVVGHVETGQPSITG